MPRKKTSDDSDERPSRVPRGVRFIIFLLVLLAIGGLVGVKYLQTPRGGVLMVDRGFDGALPRVEREIGGALKRGLEAHDLRRRLRVAPVSHASGRVQEWRVECDDAVDLLRVNVSLTQEVEAAGGVVRESEQFDAGRTLVFTVGTHTRDTHRVTLQRAAANVVVPDVPEEKRPRVAIVIDDFGYTKGGIAREVLGLELPLTIAILPELRHSTDVFRLAKATGRCVLLHLPMQGAPSQKADTETITPAMSDEEIDTLVRRYLASLPGVDGVNNHMGSLATSDERVMRAVVGAIAAQNGTPLFFLDSLTSPKSVAYTTAVAAGLRAATNTLFLDDATDRRDDVAARLHDLVEAARTHGYAIGIGHPHPWTFEALRDNLDYLETAGVELVTVCDLVRDAPAPSR